MRPGVQDQHLIAVTAAKVDDANEAAVEAMGPYAKDTFHVPAIKGSGSQPTHYITCWRMPSHVRERFRAAMEKRMQAANFDITANAGREEMKQHGYKPQTPSQDEVSPSPGPGPK